MQQRMPGLSPTGMGTPLQTCTGSAIMARWLDGRPVSAEHLNPGGLGAQTFVLS